MDGTYEGSKIVCIIKIAGLYVLYYHAEINSSSNERAKQKSFVSFRLDRSVLLVDTQWPLDGPNLTFSRPTS